jgi:hypothetical protein
LSPNLSELDLHYPIKYTEMSDLYNYLKGNETLKTLRLQKIKPFNFHFLTALAENTTLKSLTLEIFKINNHAFYSYAEHDPNYFDQLPRNNVLEELNIRGSTHKEYLVFSRYFGSFLSMFTALTTLDIRSLQFRDRTLTGDLFAIPLSRGL